MLDNVDAFKILPKLLRFPHRNIAFGFADCGCS